MLFHRLIRAAVLLASSFLVTSAHADTYFYNFSTQLTSFQVNGMLITDTNEGILSFDNVLDFNLLVTAGNLTDTLTYANSDNAGIYGYALFATEDGLYFDYDVAQSGLFIQNSSTGTYLCLQTYGCDAGFNSHESVSIAGNTLTEAQSGLVQIATIQAATPEPSSLLLLGTGAVTVVGVVRRRYVAV